MLWLSFLCLGFSYALSETFLLLPVLMLICIPAYQVFIKGDSRSGTSVATGALGEGLTSGEKSVATTGNMYGVDGERQRLVLNCVP
eukprot:COSAG02_NODE_384_length_23406_cov_9.459733_1_plen_85_part_10